MAVSSKQAHENSKIEEVLLTKLRVDRSYQRDPSQRLVDEIAEDWDIVASELILVSNRGPRVDSDVEGGLWVVNGQHRSLAARKLGHDTIWARVVDLRKEDDPAKTEAEFRLKTNVGLGDRPVERFKAQLRAGNEESLAIVKILGHFDTEINLTPNQDTGINAVSCLEGLYRWDNGALLEEVLQAAKDAYGSVHGKQTSAAMMKGLGWFIYKHAEATDRTRFIERIGKIGVGAIDRQARTIGSMMGGTLWMNYYRALVGIWNENLTEKNQLSFALKGANGFGGNSSRAPGGLQ